MGPRTPNEVKVVFQDVFSLKHLLSVQLRQLRGGGERHEMIWSTLEPCKKPWLFSMYRG